MLQELFVARLAQGAYHDALEKGAGEVCYRHLAASVRKHPKHLNFLFGQLSHNFTTSFSLTDSKKENTAVFVGPEFGGFDCHCAFLLKKA